MRDALLPRARCAPFYYQQLTASIANGARARILSIPVRPARRSVLTWLLLHATAAAYAGAGTATLEPIGDGLEPLAGTISPRLEVPLYHATQGALGGELWLTNNTGSTITNLLTAIAGFYDQDGAVDRDWIDPPRGARLFLQTTPIGGRVCPPGAVTELFSFAPSRRVRLHAMWISADPNGSLSTIRLEGPGLEAYSNGIAEQLFGQSASARSFPILAMLSPHLTRRATYDNAAGGSVTVKAALLGWTLAG